jgi:hypothetical protein
MSFPFSEFFFLNWQNFVKACSNTGSIRAAQEAPYRSKANNKKGPHPQPLKETKRKDQSHQSHQSQTTPRLSSFPFSELMSFSYFFFERIGRPTKHFIYIYII